MEDGDLCRLAVRKCAKQVQVARLGQPAGHFGLTQEADIAPPLRPRLNNNLFNARGGHSEPLDQTLGLDEPRQPAAVGTRSHPELHRVNRLALIGSRVGKELEIAGGDNQSRRTQPAIDQEPRHDQKIVVGQALGHDH